MGFKLIYNKQVPILYIINLVIYKEILTALNAKKYLAAVMNMDILVGILCIGIVESEAFITACIQIKAENEKAQEKKMKAKRPRKRQVTYFGY